jgi:hypothetical protein
MLVDGGDAGYVEQRGRDAPAELVLQRHILQVRQRPEVDLPEGRIVLDDVEILISPSSVSRSHSSGISGLGGSTRLICCFMTASIRWP